jgi:hypothetical protein
MDQSLIALRGKKFLSSQQHMGPTQPAVQWEVAILSPGVKLHVVKLTTHPPSCVKVKSSWHS